MHHRPTSEIIQSLRATLRHIEENLALDANVSVLVELKRIILLRIDDLEATNATSPIGSSR